MSHFDVSTKAVFFDLWNTLLVGDKDESIIKWYRSLTSNDSISFDRDNCMKIKEENIEKFLQSFLANVNDPYSLRFLLAIRSRSSSLRDDMVASFKAILSKDFKNTRWLPGAIDVLLALKENLITVGISNLWAYQKPVGSLACTWRNFVSNVRKHIKSGKIDCIKYRETERGSYLQRLGRLNTINKTVLIKLAVFG